jgi:hypothetical protein
VHAEFDEAIGLFGQGGQGLRQGVRRGGHQPATKRDGRKVPTIVDNRQNF